MKNSLSHYLLSFGVLWATEVSGAPFDELLPNTGTNGHLMALSVPKRLEELSAKMMESIKKNQEWFRNASQQKRGLAPMPYDERLGISREEYEEYVQLVKQGGSLKEVAPLKFDVLENADGSHSLDVGPGLPQLKGIKFDSKRDVIETPYGKLKGPKEKEITENGGGLGPWKGLVYELIDGTVESVAQASTGKSIALTVGKQSKTGRRFLIYKAIVAENGVRTAGFEIIVTY